MKLNLKNNKIYMYLLACSTLQKFKRIVRADPELSHGPFLGTKQPICPEQFFLAQIIIITFICLLALFIVQNLQNSYSRSKIVTMPYFELKMVQLPPIFFFFFFFENY